MFIQETAKAPTRIYTHENTNTCVHMHTHTRARARTHAHTHARTHTHTHTHKWMYIYLVFVGSADDVLVSDGEGVHAPTTLALEHVNTLQRIQVPDLQHEGGREGGREGEEGRD